METLIAENFPPVMETLVAENFGAFASRLYLKRHRENGELLLTMHEASRARQTEYKASVWLNAEELMRIATALMEAAVAQPTHHSPNPNPNTQDNG